MNIWSCAARSLLKCSTATTFTPAFSAQSFTANIGPCVYAQFLEFFNLPGHSPGPCSEALFGTGGQAEGMAENVFQIVIRNGTHCEPRCPVRYSDLIHRHFHCTQAKSLVSECTIRIRTSCSCVSKPKCKVIALNLLAAIFIARSRLFSTSKGVPRQCPLSVQFGSATGDQLVAAPRFLH